MPDVIREPKSEYWVGDNDMDAETAAAFEEFVAEGRSRSSRNDVFVRSEHRTPLSRQHRGAHRV
jgi:hypothetical protein